MTKSLIILDPGLKDFMGHYFEYVRSIAEASLRRGFKCIILSHKTAAQLKGLPFDVNPVYSADIWAILSGNDYNAPENLQMVSEQFVSQTIDFLSGIPIREEDIIFLPNIARAHILGAAMLAEKYGPTGAQMYYLLRYPHAFYTGDIATKAFRDIEISASNFKVKFCTDSHRLADDLASLTKLPIAVFPIPHTDHTTTQSKALKPGSPVNFVGLGNARGEKGLSEIFQAVRRSAEMPWATQVSFTLQINDPYFDIVDEIRAFSHNLDPRVTLIDRVLDTNEYYGLLETADVVLVPYHHSSYRERSSGVFLEAITAGKIVVCTDDTWMSDVIRMHGGGLAIADRSPAELCSAIGEIAGNFASFQTRARAAAAHWRTVHSPENFVAHLSGDLNKPVVISSRRKAAVLYPWDDAVSGNSGAASRLKLLIKYLEQHYVEVRVLFAGNPNASGPVGVRSTAISYEHQSRRNQLLYNNLEKLSRLLGGKAGQSFHLWFHLWPLLDRGFQLRCDEIIQWADSVYLEYSYFTPIVADLCEKYEKHLTVTQYDVLSDQSMGVPLIHRLTQYLEFKALKRAPRVIAISENDQKVFASHHIMSEILPHPIDIDDSMPFLDSQERQVILNGVYGIPVEGKKICLFVGSAYDPNRQAAEFIRAMAKRMREERRANDVFFVVLGGCMTPRCEENFMALGLIENVGLLACYMQADIVLVPVTEGTGMSVKSIQALSNGSAVISTSVGMRGIHVESGKHCIIEDDLTAYPDLILSMLENHEMMQKLRDAAKAFAACFDYRNVFAKLDPQESPDVAITEARPGRDCARREQAFCELLPRLQQMGDPIIKKFLSEKLSSSEASL